MIAILTSDGDGNDVIVAIVSDNKYINEYIKKYSGWKPKGFQEMSLTEAQEYYCVSFKESKGIILTT